ncbi:predicted protein [Plenodomus lingam JN3]|uniref:Predicted protein n=1 Tax=Leptosphaeria maculans (strain JN3 / isolate v23.1.3 / race Av1-4-5-6-7-8) TaxID=985895 RepID=E5A1S6_LEPMJ|nr:predicted protein [Plenodomus lingam JN3]CBX97643.1 predicted protein [Plenodomus lingam JN3]
MRLLAVLQYSTVMRRPVGCVCGGEERARANAQFGVLQWIAGSGKVREMYRIESSSEALQRSRAGPQACMVLTVAPWHCGTVLPLGKKPIKEEPQQAIKEEPQQAIREEPQQAIKEEPQQTHYVGLAEAYREETAVAGWDRTIIHHLVGTWKREDPWGLQVETGTEAVREAPSCHHARTQRQVPTVYLTLSLSLNGSSYTGDGGLLPNGTLSTRDGWDRHCAIQDAGIVWCGFCDLNLAGCRSGLVLVAGTLHASMAPSPPPSAKAQPSNHNCATPHPCK